MVAQFLRLKLTLFANSFRRSPWQVIGLVLSIAYGASTAVFVVGGLFALRLLDVELAGSAVVVLGTVIFLGFALLPLTLGIDDTLDPRRFALYGISTTRLAANLVIAALVSVPAVVIVAIALGQIATWTRGPLPTLLAIASAVVIVATALLSARITTSIASFLLATRRARDVSGIAGIVLLVALSPVVILLAGVDWGRSGLAVLAAVADVAAWTPLGAAWGAPAAAALGDLEGAGAKLAIAVGWAGILWFAWRGLVSRMLTTPQRQPHAKAYVGLGWFDVFPRTPTGAIAARSLTYWFRDSRYSTSLVVIPLIPVFMVIALVIGGLPLQQLALLPVPVMCLFLGWAVHNDVAFDNTAVWLHLSTSTVGRADRWGRVVPVLVVGIPLVILGSIASAWIFGDWAVVASLVGVSTCILFSGLGLSSVMSALFPYPAVRPGDSPFAQPQGTGSPAGPIQAVSFFTIIVLALPALVVAAMGLISSPLWHLVSLAYGVVVGLTVLLVGVSWGSRIYDRRTSELLAFAMRN